MKRKTKSRIALIGALILLAAATFLCTLMLSWEMAADTPPSPGAVETSSDALSHDADGQQPGFPVVDWDYWKGVNPDVIGWITIPGTKVNSPILQAHADDPEYYLHHDVYRHYNPHGALYLDADCTDGLLSRNAIIMGHHFRQDTAAAPFGVIASYTDRSFAEEHAAIYIQTPDWKMVYVPRFAQIVNGLERNKRTDFDGDSDFREWYDDAREGAAMVLDSDTEPDQTISLVTCSYNIWVKNERTVLVTSRETNQNQTENAPISAEPS